MSAKPNLSLVGAPRRHSVATDLTTVAGRLAHYRQKLLERELAPRTVTVYWREIQRAEWWCEQQGYSLRNVPSLVFGQYVEIRPKTHATRHIMRSALTHYWSIFKRKDPPLWLVKRPRKPRMVCRALTDEEAMALASVARARGGREAFAVLLAMYQGLRREEISKVAWQDFSKDGWLHVLGKGDLPAKIPVHPVVAEALGRLERPDPIWVFPGKRGTAAGAGPVAPSTVWAWVKALAKEAGIEGVAPHRLRHTCLATANDATGDLRAVQDFARHAKVDTTSGYTRSTARRLNAVLAAISYDGDQARDPEAELAELLAFRQGWRFEQTSSTAHPGAFIVWREAVEPSADTDP